MNGQEPRFSSLPSAVRQARNVRCTCWKRQEPHGLQVARSPTQKIQKSWEITQQIRGFRKLLRQGQLSKTISFPVHHQLPSRNWLKITFKTVKTNTPTENLNSNEPWREKARQIREKTCLGMLCLPLLGSSSGALTPQPGLCAQLSVPGSNVFRSSPACLLSPSLALYPARGSRQVQSHLVGCVAKLCQPAPQGKWSAAVLLCLNPD